MSSEAQKIAIYELDRKNSLRLSPITRRSNDGSEDKSIFSDSDSVQSVVDVSKRATKASSFMSLTNSSIGEELVNDYGDDDDNDDDQMPSTSFSVTGSERRVSVNDDGGECASDDSEEGQEEEPRNFGSGKRALDQNTSSAFFSTVYCDDEYLSDQKLSDRERSTSPAQEPVVAAPRKLSDLMSEDSLNSTGSLGDSSASDRSQSIDNDEYEENVWKNVENGIRKMEILRATVEPTAEVASDDMIYRPRDGIPKYVMLPNPFYQENASTDGGNKVKFELSVKHGEIIPPRIPRREPNDSGRSSATTIPVITVTAETTSSTTDIDPSDAGSPKSVLKKIIFAPSFGAKPQRNATDMTPSSLSYFDKYNNANSTAFETLRKSPDRDRIVLDRERTVLDREQEFRWRRTATNSPPRDESDLPEMVVVKHYGDIVERYSGVAKRPASKTYLDFEQLKMAAAVEGSEPVMWTDDEFRQVSAKEEYGVDDDERMDGEADEELELVQDLRDDDLSPTVDYGGNQRFQSEDYASSQTENRLQVMETPVTVETISYLKIVGNVSLAMFGYWLYACKDERLSVPIFGFLLVRFFKTQIWDRI